MAHLRLPAWLALTLILSALALLVTSNRPALANWPGQNGKIAFVTDQEAVPQGLSNAVIGIGTMDPDGSHRTISEPTTSLGIMPLSWSADGTKLAVVDLTGSTPQINYLTFDNGVFTGSRGVTAGKFATWVPDNTHLIAVIRDDLAVIDLNGNVVEQLTTTPGVREVDAALSPDLSTIVFSSNEDPDENPAMPPHAGSFYNLWI